LGGGPHIPLFLCHWVKLTINELRGADRKFITIDTINGLQGGPKMASFLYAL